MNRLHPGVVMVAGKLRVALWMGTALSLAGCMLSNVKPEFSPESQGNRGLLVVSLGRTGAGGFDLVATVKPLDAFFTYTIVIDSMVAPKDFGSAVAPGPGLGGPDRGYIPGSRPLGRLVVAALPAGDYELSGVSGSSSVYGRGSPFQLTSDRLSLRFTVRPARITYLGSIVFAFPDWIGVSQNRGPLRVVVTDERDRDGKLLKERYPRLGSDLPGPSVTGIPVPAQALHYYLHSDSAGGGGGGGGGGM